MGVDVLDLVGVETGIADRVQHRATRAVGRRRGHVVGVAAHAEAGHFGVDACAARTGVFVVLEHHHAGTLAKDEAIAILVPRPARAGGVVVARRQRTRRGEAADAERRHRPLGTARHHHVDVTVHDHARGLADRVQTGRTRGHHGEVGPLDPVKDRQVPGNHVDDRARNEEGRDLARPGFRHHGVGFLDQRQATDARADVDADAFGIGLGDFETGVADGLDARGHAVLDEQVHPSRFLGIEILPDIEIPDFARHVRGEGLGIETGDAGDA